MTYTDLFLFLVGLGGAINFSIGGDVFVSDILLIVAIPFFWRKVNTVKFGKTAKVLLGFGVLWFINQVITDGYKGTPFGDWSRGWGKIIFFFLNAFSLSLISGGRLRSIVCGIAGFNCSLILETIFFPNELQSGGCNFDDGAWKFGLGPGLTTLAAIIGTGRPARRLFGKRANSLRCSLWV